MIIMKGQLLKIVHYRTGTWVARASQGFDSEMAIWYPVVLAEGSVQGISRNLGCSGKWLPGDEIPCLASLVKSIEVLSPKEE